MTDRLLILGDESLQDNFFVTTLPEAGFTLKSVTDTNQSLQSLNEYKPDLILVDITLEERSGFTICSSLHRDTTLPIVLFGHQAYMYLWLNRLESEADFYLILSWENTVKLEVLRAILRRHRWND